MRQTAYSKTLTFCSLGTHITTSDFGRVRQDDRFSSCTHAEMPIHTLQVLLDSSGANAERLTDFLVREPFQQPSEYNFLSAR